jgi:plasmid stability protein
MRVDGMLLACYGHAVANLQVKAVPEALHRRIRSAAKRRGRTVGEFVLDAVTRALDDEEFRARLARRAPTDIGGPAARVVEKVRAERDRDLGA